MQPGILSLKDLLRFLNLKLEMEGGENADMDLAAADARDRPE